MIFFPFGYWTFWERGPDHLLLCSFTHYYHSLIVLVIVFESESLSLSLSLSFYNYIGSDHKAQPLLTSGSAWLNRHNWGVCFLLGLFVFVFGVCTCRACSPPNIVDYYYYYFYYLSIKGST